MPLSKAITTNIVTPPTKKNITVIGAGVVGLSTALTLQERGYAVSIIADQWPDDEKSIKYTSAWAGAHHVSLAGSDERQRKMDRETFEKMWRISESGSDAEHCFMRVQQTEFYVEKEGRGQELAHMPNIRPVTKDELHPGAQSGFSFQTVTIDTPVYLQYLYHTFLARGGKTIRIALQHISQVLAYAFSTDLIVICNGLGARSLGGVEDVSMYPICGQTVLLRAPWVRFGVTLSELGEDGIWTYVIPRRSGDVIVGGTKVAHDWHPSPRPEITRDILERAAKLCPQLVGLDRSECTVEDLERLVIAEGCGLRPARVGGIRLEGTTVEVCGRKVGIVYNYGHGGYGYQSSWGSANLAADLVEKALH